MPIYEYQAKSPASGCEFCSVPFERLQKLSDPPLTVCPKCEAVLEKVISTPSVGYSSSDLDDRAKNAGFTKLKRVNKGEYEKKF